MASQPQGRAKPKAPKAPKAKILQALRNVQTEQLAKLQQKYQFEQDLLEDIRSYSKQRSAIEKEYAQNLQKLNNNFIQKQEFSSSKEKDITFKSPEAVWRTFLEESENVSKKRLEIAEGLQAQVADEVKTFKANKAQVFKKCSEMTQKVQEELFETIREMSKSKKNYMEAEKLSQVAGEQAAEAEDKYKKKNTKFFQSKSALGKNVSKSSSRKEACEKRAVMARNEYLLNLAASNAHVVQYYCTDLQRIMNSIYGDYYETIREYLLTMGKLEVDAAAIAKDGFENLLSEAERINKDYCVQCFLTKNNVFTEVIRYDYEPCRHDEVSTLSMDKNAGLALNKEARKLAMRVVREQKNIKEKQKALSGLKSSDVKTSESSSTGDPNQDPEDNPETIQEAIRKAELIKLKSEACLDLLKEAGVNVEEWLKSANSLSPMDEQGLSSSQTSLDSENPTENAGWMDDEWDADDTFLGDYESDEDAQSITSTGSLPLPCIALYNFEASTTDELNIVENEELEVLERDSDGWCKGRNKKGELGYFPESYVQFQSKKRPSLVSNHSGSGHSGSGHSGSFTDGSLGASPGRTGSAAMAQQQNYICLVRALFDYEAVGDDEISFSEGDIIEVTRKDDNGVDDGFWEGHVDGRFGVFPSLVVEEIEGSEQDSAQQTQESTYSVPHIAKTSNKKVDDYIELPKDYVPGSGSHVHTDTHTTAVSTPSPGDSPYLQPKRKAPPPPAATSRKTLPTLHTNSLEPVERRRVQTENVTTMRKPDWGTSYNRSVSHEHHSAAANAQNSDRKTVYSACSSDYVYTSDIPPEHGTGTRGTSPKPPKPPPPTKYKSKSYV